MAADDDRLGTRGPRSRMRSTLCMVSEAFRREQVGDVEEERDGLEVCPAASSAPKNMKGTVEDGPIFFPIQSAYANRTLRRSQRAAPTFL